MRFSISAFGAAFITCVAALTVCAQQAATTQQPTEQRAQLDAQAIAFDAQGREAIGARLRTQQLQGSVDSPITDVRIVVENRSGLFYTFISGWATFYEASGVRCGEGLFKLDALAASESAETDTPGIRLTCAPATWRIVATNLLTRTSDTAKPADTQPTTMTTQSMNLTSAPVVAPPALEISINGEVHPVQLNNPLSIRVGKQRVQIVVRQAP